MKIPKFVFQAPDSWLNSNAGSGVDHEEDQNIVENDDINFSPEVTGRGSSPLMIDTNQFCFTTNVSPNINSLKRRIHHKSLIEVESAAHN